jgi:hypothetical protein
MNRSLLPVLAGLAFVALNANVANAQATRTWVSGVGDDANPCSRTAPCKTFAGAISKTAPAGEINVLDPGGFGAVTITKSITISADHVQAGVLVSGTNGIVVAAGATDTVILQGLDIEGLGTGLDAIKVNSGLKVYVTRCKIHHFAGNGINMASSTSGARLFVKDSLILENGTANSNPLTGGININGTANIGSIVDTVIDSSQNFGGQASGASNIIAFVRSVINNTPVAINLVSGGQGFSFGPSNVFSGSTTGVMSVNFQ